MVALKMIKDDLDALAKIAEKANDMYLKSNEKAMTLAGVHYDENSVSVKCDIANKKLMMALNAASPGKVGIAVGSTESGEFGDIIVRNLSELEPTELFQMMEEHFGNSPEIHGV